MHINNNGGPLVPASPPWWLAVSAAVGLAFGSASALAQCWTEDPDGYVCIPANTCLSNCRKVHCNVGGLPVTYDTGLFIREDAVFPMVKIAESGLGSVKVQLEYRTFEGQEITVTNCVVSVDSGLVVVGCYAYYPDGYPCGPGWAAAPSGRLHRLAALMTVFSVGTVTTASCLRRRRIR